MRLYKNAIILVVVLGLLVGAYAVIKNKKGDTQQTESSTDIKVLELDKEKMEEVTLEGKDGKFVFGKKDKDWVLVSPSGFKASKTKIDSFVLGAASIIADKVVEENASDLTQYGLNEPVRVIIKMNDGTLNTVEVGTETPTKEGTYIKLKDSNKVFVVSSYTGETLKPAKKDLADKALFDIKTEDVKGFSLEKKGSVVFTTQKDGEAWRLTAPIEGMLELNKLLPIIESAIQINIAEVIDENASDLDKYGLKNPSYAIEVDSTKGKTKILLGAEKEKGVEIYAKLADSNIVFTVGESNLNFIDKPLKEVMDRFVYLANINDVNKIVVEMDGKTIVSDIQTDSENKENDKFTVDGKEANMKDDSGNMPFRKYYQALIGVTMSELEIGSNPSGKADITITYHIKKAPGTVKVEFIPKDNKYYYAYRNGKNTNMLIAKKVFDEPQGIRDSYNKLIEAINKK